MDTQNYFLSKSVDWKGLLNTSFKNIDSFDIDINISRDAFV